MPANRIAIGNGSCDVLLAAGDALLEPGAEIVYAWPSFSVYPHLAAASGARAIEVPVDAEHRHDLEAMRREITVATRLAIVCNPNNPTSTALPLDEVAAFVADVPRHVCVILDEAYVEFSLLQDPDESLALLDKHPNLVLLRTFSKIYGLCGLRVGYALAGSEEFRTAVDQVRQPFFCNAAAQAAALEALNHQDEVARRVERNLAERVGLEDGLRALGHRARRRRRPTSSGSTVGEGREEPEIVRGLAERGVLVRAGTALGREGALRVTVGTAGRERAVPGSARRPAVASACHETGSSGSPLAIVLATPGVGGGPESSRATSGPTRPRRSSERPARSRRTRRRRGGRPGHARRRRRPATGRAARRCWHGVAAGPLSVEEARAAIEELLNALRRRPTPRSS